ncbi:hypothetical protein [Thiocapsa bogorovii]|nr:hypothetical protein [Thiocapsa bogorovii]UHD16875.1 hypothetical protein LT988_02070 [Thiocapsa bogorovii]
MTTHQRLAFLSSTLLALVAIFALYLPGTYGALYYDDYNALNGMSAVENFDDAKRFILEGTAGPLGRPISLLTFLAHSKKWPENRHAILRVNVIIHIANAFLLGAIAAMILRLRGVTPIRAYWTAFGAATLWATMPILASSSLIAIQRMTTLAAFFGLLGIAGFVVGYWLRLKRPHFAFALQFGSLGLGTLLGLYSKESAALIPVFVLLIDTLLLGNRRFHGHLHFASRTLLFSALALLLWYLSPLRLDWFTIVELRGWSPWERLQYQVVMLWEYLRLAIAPLPTAFGPFHDHRNVIDFSALQCLIAATAWAIVTALSAWIYVRLKNPWPLFALLWFFTGHLLESTVLSLELVFEHRNYLAVFGIAFALSIATTHAPGKLARVAPMLFVSLLAINAASLFAMTTLWGDQRHAAAQWANRNPESPRAALHAAFIETGVSDTGIADANNRFIHDERKRYAIQILDRTSQMCADCADVRIQALLHACKVEDERAIRERFENLRISLENTGEVNISVVDGVFVLESLLEHRACPPLQTDDLLKLIEAINYREDHIDTNSQTRMLFVAAKICYANNRHMDALDILSQAERIAPHALPVLQFQVHIYDLLGDTNSAQASIARRRTINRSNTAMTDLTLDILERKVQDKGLNHSETDKEIFSTP